MKLKKFRIVKDNHLGYECQEWNWYWPFWIQMDFSNTHSTIERAEEFIQIGKVVKYVDRK